jgi:hypothetical protein
MEPDHYRKKARECVRAARRMNDPGERLILLTVAHQFALLAAHVSERPDRGPYASGGNVTPEPLAYRRRYWPIRLDLD